MNHYEDIPDDQFVDIPGWEGYYQVNKLCQFKSIDRVVEHKKDGHALIKGKLLTVSLNMDGYCKIRLTKGNKTKCFNVYRILAEMFIPNPFGYKLVRHLNDIKTDNRLSNLAWGTYMDNTLDADRNGLIRRGKEHHWYGRRVEPPNKGKKGIDSLYNKIILDTQSGIFYIGTQDAASAKGINASTLRCKLSGHYKNNTGLIYV